MNMGQTRWYDVPDGNENYIVALDPSMGTGGDFVLPQVFEVPVINKWQNGDIMKHLIAPNKNIKRYLYIYKRQMETHEITFIGV